MGRFQNKRRTGNVCHRLQLPRSSARTRLSTALEPSDLLESPPTVGIFSVARRPLPPAQIYAPPAPTPKETVVERVIEKVREVTRVRPVTIEEAIAKVRNAGAWPKEAKDPDQHKEIALLERRLAKISGLLDSNERELARLRSQKTVDTGVASTYREVQGISADDEQAEAKKEMMSQLFAANLKLHQGISSQKRSGD